MLLIASSVKWILKVRIPTNAFIEAVRTNCVCTQNGFCRILIVRRAFPKQAMGTETALGCYMVEEAGAADLIAGGHLQLGSSAELQGR